jgi:3D (Asp-Asp-Asp) domain-containing protein
MLARSWGENVAVTAVVALAFILLYQAQASDSKDAARHAVFSEPAALPAPGATLRFSATAYCKGAITASGVAPRTGVAAADPALLPVGSVIQVGAESPHAGIYTIMDTGPAVQGRQIDIYMWSCRDAVQFGRRPVDVLVLRLGWDPRASPPSLMHTLLHRPRPPRQNLPSTALPLGPITPPR